MLRIYKPVGPSSNKAAKPVQETKAAAKPTAKENSEKRDSGEK